MLSGGVEAALCGALGAFFRHQTDSMRHRLQRDTEHLLGGRHLEIQRLVDLRFQARNIIVTNVAAIFPQVRGNAVAACGNCKLCRAHRVGMTPAAGIADGSHMIDIDAQTETIQAISCA